MRSSHELRGVLLGGLGLLGLTGCLASAQLQEPAALPPGEWEVSVGGGGFGIIDYSAATDEAASGEADADDSIPFLPSAQLGLRVGLVDRLEGYGLASWPNGLIVGAKYQAVGDYGGEGFALSFSLDSNLIGIINDFETTGLFDASFVNLNARTYLGWTWKDNASIFVAPGVNAFYSLSESEAIWIPALALGGRSAKLPLLGGDIQLCLEIASAIAPEAALYQAMGGIAF